MDFDDRASLDTSQLEDRRGRSGALGSIPGGLGGAAVGGTSGSAWGVAAATISGSAVWWLQLRSALREHHREPIPEVRTS